MSEIKIPYEILELFPTPILATQMPDNLGNIVEWFYKQEMSGTKGEKGVDALNYGDRSKNSYIFEEPECKDIKQYILDLGLMYGKSLGYDYNSYKFSQSWISIKHPNQHHNLHFHPNSLISGVLYFGTYTEETPSIRFSKSPYSHFHNFQPKMVNDKRELKYAQTEFNIVPNPGMILLFPSTLWHSVPPNTSPQPRYSIAFNIIPTEGIGDEHTLTELKF